MNHLRYRLETLPAALNSRKMSQPINHALSAKSRRTWVLLVGLVALVIVAQRSTPPKVALEPTPPTVDPALVAKLAEARIDNAKLKLEQRHPDEALAILINALEEDADSTEARELVGSILGETTWSLPTITLKHSMPVEQIALETPTSLWVSLSGQKNTTVRWNLETLEIESVLFPTSAGATRTLVLHPPSQSLVVERNSVTLLCNSQSLHPIRDLGILPDNLTPSAVVVFSQDGLLMAHPAWVSATDRSIIWQIRDTSTGEAIRITDPSSDESSRPLAAFLSRHQLRVINTDGSLLEIPVSPVEPIKQTPAEQPVKLLQAQFSTNGNSALTLQDMGPHQAPAQSVVTYGEEDESLRVDALTQRFPWSKQPNIWNALMKDPRFLPFSIEGIEVKILTYPHAPILATSAVTAVAIDSDSVIIGEENGTVTFYHLLLPPDEISAEHEAAAMDDASVKALRSLAKALAGVEYDENARSFTRDSYEERMKAFKECDFDAIFAVYPNLDFSSLIDEFTSIPSRMAVPSALDPLHARIARSEAVDPLSPLVSEVSAAFQSGDPTAVLAAIQNAGPNGPELAHALVLALESERPEWIQACLSQAQNLPPLLRQIALSRIAWLQGRKADALAQWTEAPPDLRDIRLREDWDGWEQADFNPVLEALILLLKDQLAAIRIPKNSNAEQRKALANHLAEPSTIATVGKPRFAAACFDLAVLLASLNEEPGMTAKLARAARNLGAPPEICLRAEASALTTLGDFNNARSRWVELITEHPAESLLPSDFTEAAYTAFENEDSRQAIEILNTGIKRFSEDASFALRAGWIAMLTGNYDRAYHFLKIAKRTGLPQDKIENATALLVIAASRSGAADEAATYFQDLLLINPDWEYPETVETFDWPEEFKSTIREYTQGPIMPDLLPELEPTNP